MFYNTIFIFVLVFLFTLGIVLLVGILFGIVTYLMKTLRDRPKHPNPEEYGTKTEYFFEDKKLGITMESFPDGPGGQVINWLDCPLGHITLSYGYPNFNVEIHNLKVDLWNSWMKELGASERAYKQRDGIEVSKIKFGVGSK
jgi:hypothetical protein